MPHIFWIIGQHTLRPINDEIFAGGFLKLFITGLVLTAPLLFQVIPDDIAKVKVTGYGVFANSMDNIF